MIAAIDTVLNYHERTKHYLHRYAGSPETMDWANQPNPFRHYEGAPRIALEHGDNTQGPLYRDLFSGPIVPGAVTYRTISRLFYYSMALSAWKKIPGGGAWPLRVNPSSGNLHPTESYLIIGQQAALSIKTGLYHYNSYYHALEANRFFGKDLWTELACHIPEDGFFVGLSSIYWREAWKYGERAYRYCQHDVGHALGAIAIAAASLGWKTELVDSLTDDDIGILLGIENQGGVEAEHVDCLVAIYPNIGHGQMENKKNRVLQKVTTESLANIQKITVLGEINKLSESHREWPLIDEVSLATKKTDANDPERLSSLPPETCVLPVCTRKAFEIIRQRRSAVSMDGKTAMDRPVFFSMLQRLQYQQSIPFECLPWTPNVSLFLFVHRVRDLQPGLYVLVRHASHETSMRRSINPDFLWERMQDTSNPQTRFYLLAPQDVRREAKVISCHQDIAADGVFSLGMLARFDDIRDKGAYFYPRLFWETGLIGQLLYLEAEAAGMRSTGIGCFFDDEMHQVLGMTDHCWQSLYHFTVGGADEDVRVQTYPAYGHLESLESGLNQ